MPPCPIRGCCAASGTVAHATSASNDPYLMGRLPLRAVGIIPASGPAALARSIRGARALAAVCAVCVVASARPPQASSQGDPSAWRPQTVPLWGVSYSPDIGLLIGAAARYIRYGFHALPPSTRLFAKAAYATSAARARAGPAGEVRRPLFPAPPSAE